MAIAHEVHTYGPIPAAPPLEQARVAPKLYLTEEEEDEEFASGDMQHEDTRKALEEIVAATGMSVPISFQ